MFFNYVQQGLKEKGQYQVHYSMFARQVGTNSSIVFSIREAIC
jgi:hypothetical protein